MLGFNVSSDLLWRFIDKHWAENTFWMKKASSGTFGNLVQVSKYMNEE